MSAVVGVQVPAFKMQVELHPQSPRSDTLHSLDLYGAGVALIFTGTEQQLADLARRMVDMLRKGGIDV